jgi:hypothetical protein
VARIGQHDGALDKHNLMLAGDPYGLAFGYPEAEKTAVREYLLGAPWTRLVLEAGLYRQHHGKEFNFYCVLGAILAASAAMPAFFRIANVADSVLHLQNVERAIERA